MLIKYNGELKLVYGIRFFPEGCSAFVFRIYDERCARNCENPERFDAFFETFGIMDVEKCKVVDARIPPNWIFTPENEHSVCCCLFPKGFERDSGDTDDFDDLFGSYIGYDRTLIANEMLAFHGLPQIEIPPEFMPIPEVTEEEARLNRIERELNGYLEYADK